MYVGAVYAKALLDNNIADYRYKLSSFTPAKLSPKIIDYLGMKDDYKTSSI